MTSDAVPLSVRCAELIHRNPGGMTGFEIAKALGAPPRGIVHMMSRLCTLKIIAKRRQGDHFIYFEGPLPAPPDLGAVINGAAGKGRPGADGFKHLRSAVTWAEMVKALPIPRTPLERAYKALCEPHADGMD